MNQGPYRTPAEPPEPFSEPVHIPSTEIELCILALSREVAKAGGRLGAVTLDIVGLEALSREFRLSNKEFKPEPFLRVYTHDGSVTVKGSF